MFCIFSVHVAVTMGGPSLGLVSSAVYASDGDGVGGGKKNPKTHNKNIQKYLNSIFSPRRGTLTDARDGNLGGEKKEQLQKHIL